MCGPNSAASKNYLKEAILWKIELTTGGYATQMLK